MLDKSKRLDENENDFQFQLERQAFTSRYLICLHDRFRLLFIALLLV